MPADEGSLRARIAARPGGGEALREAAEARAQRVARYNAGLCICDDENGSAGCPKHDPVEDEYTLETRPWRTLVEIRTIDLRRGRFYVELPGWISDEPIVLDLNVLTDEQVASALRQDGRLHARVNTGAEHAGDLTFSDWEP